MTRYAKTVWIFILGAIIVVLLAFLGRDLYLGSARSIECEDGQRQTIDLRDFRTQYSAYSYQLEAQISDKFKLSGKADPTLLQDLSEALQHANEFRKSLVAGFNACAITKSQYGRYLAQFQILDNLSRQIDHLAGKPTFAESDRTQLEDLIHQFVVLSQRMAE